MDPQKLFENYFDDETITTPRLTAFGVDHLNRLVQANGSNAYEALIAGITRLLNDMGIELSGVEGRLRIQKGLTQTADEVMERLKDYMKDNEDELRYKLKGIPGAILGFYPQDNRTLYNNLSKERMPVITGALATAAATHEATLGKLLSADLQAFALQWQAASDAQEQGMGGLSQGREHRDALRPQLNNILMSHVHTIANLFGNDAEGAMALFNFTLLWYKGMRPKGSRGGESTVPATV